MAAILHDPKELTFRQTCGGSILTTTAILSAASCFVNQSRPNPASQYRIRVGSDQPNAGGSVHAVRLITLHPAYDYRTKSADVAVLRVTTLAYSLTVQPVTIAGINYNVSDSDTLFVLGWGQNQSSGLNNTLRYASQNTISQTYCTAVLGYEGVQVTEDMLCTRRTSGEFCQGDYGGPVIHASNSVQVGVASYSYQCGVKRYPSLSAKVAYHAVWIAYCG
ncbi:trypsin CFT-1-like [Choristoneura fumiferana]|uniref:trypsin CFT-1-like n=1 Tax=Choristoneura fumiferana TaxID=7141 RepID=UPI003D15CFB7